MPPPAFRVAAFRVFQVNGKCCYCSMARALRKPSEDKERPTGSELVVYQNDLFVAFCPWAPPCDYAIYIMPWAHTVMLAGWASLLTFYRQCHPQSFGHSYHLPSPHPPPSTLHPSPSTPLISHPSPLNLLSGRFTSRRRRWPLASHERRRKWRQLECRPAHLGGPC